MYLSGQNLEGSKKEGTSADEDLCDNNAPKADAYESQGPRLVLHLRSRDGNQFATGGPFGFKATVKFQTGTDERLRARAGAVLAARTHFWPFTWTARTGPVSRRTRSSVLLLLPGRSPRASCRTGLEWLSA